MCLPTDPDLLNSLDHYYYILLTLYIIYKPKFSVKGDQVFYSVRLFI